MKKNCIIHIYGKIRICDIVEDKSECKNKCHANKLEGIDSLSNCGASCHFPAIVYPNNYKDYGCVAIKGFTNYILICDGDKI